MHISEIIADRYEIIRSIGSGASARAYLALDTVLQREVAVKRLRQEFWDEHDLAARFEREAQAAARVNHPNTIQIFDFGRDSNDAPYIVMEYVDGPSLREYIDAQGPLPAGDIVRLGGQILEGLAAIHKHDIIHRDVKSQNVLLAADNIPKLSDFGIAFLAAHPALTASGMTIGTAAYMSPEQASSGSVGPASDLYSAGVILFEMATGQLPFTGDTAMSVAFQHVNEPPPAPIDIRPDIPDALNTVILLALTKDPDARYQTAEEMRAALFGEETRQFSSQPATGVAADQETRELPITSESSGGGAPPPNPVGVGTAGAAPAGAGRRLLFTLILILLILLAIMLTVILPKFDDDQASGEPATTPTLVGEPTQTPMATVSETPTSVPPTQTEVPVAPAVPAPSNTPIPATETPVPPASATPEPPTPTLAEPTATALLPTATPAPPSPTATRNPPTPVPPTVTLAPTASPQPTLAPTLAASPIASTTPVP